MKKLLLTRLAIALARRKLHSRHSVCPAQAARNFPRVQPALPTSTVQIAAQPPLHTAAQSAPHQSHPASAALETPPLPAQTPALLILVARSAASRRQSPPHKQPRHARSPIAASQKTSAPRHQTPNTALAANISDCAATQALPAPNSKSHNADIPRVPKTRTRSRKIPPSHLHSALAPHYTASHLAESPNPAGCLHLLPTNKSRRAAAQAPQAARANLSNSQQFAPATPQSNQN